MMKALWRGHIQLGQFGVPIRLYAATRSIRPQFVLLHEVDGSPVERMLRCQAEGREIRFQETIRAAQMNDGKRIALTGRELARIGHEPHAMLITQFCPMVAIEPVYIEKPFYITPARGGEAGYSLFREVLAQRGYAAIVRYALRGDEQIGAMHVRGDILVLMQLRYAAQLVPRSDIKTQSLPKPRPAEVDALNRLIDKFSGPFYMEDYHDEYAEHLQELVERKAKGLSMPKPERIDAQSTKQEDIVPTLQTMLKEQQTLGAGR